MEKENIKDLELSVVIPVYNEEENIEELHKSLIESLLKITEKFEIIFIDDGSKDNSWETLLKVYKKDRRVKLIKFRKNFGQTAALDAGIKLAGAGTIVTIDSDLQNDPKDIILLLKELDKGYDAVSGWRHKRKDSSVRNLLSRCAYLLRRAFLQDVVHDSGCTLKVFSKECFENLSLYGEMHRFIPAILAWKGYKIGEVKVAHYPRRKGKTKYNLSRLMRGFLDLLVLRFWFRYSTRPIHLFGAIGIILLISGFSIGVYLSILKIFYNAALAGRPLLLLSVLLFTVGVQFIIFGILADIMIQIYYSSRTGQCYNIKELLDQKA